MDERVGHAIELHAKGKRPQEIADSLGVNPATVYRWLSRDREAKRAGLGPAATELEALLADVELDGPGRFNAAIARQVAGKLDDARASDAVGAYQAVPVIAKELRAIVADILGASGDDEAWVADLFS